MERPFVQHAQPRSSGDWNNDDEIAEYYRQHENILSAALQRAVDAALNSPAPPAAGEDAVPPRRLLACTLLDVAGLTPLPRS